MSVSDAKTDIITVSPNKEGFAEGLLRKGCLVAKIFHSEIANGFVTSINAEKARALPGVVKIVSCFDIPNIGFSFTDFSSELGRVNKKPDAVLLSKRIRHYAEPILVVVAQDSFTAQRAIELIKVEYSQNTPFTSPNSGDIAGEGELHEGIAGNLYGHYEEQHEHQADEAESYSGVYSVNATYAGSVPGCFSYMEKGRLIIHSRADGYTVRKKVGETLNLPMSSIRVIKEGNGNDYMFYEPISAYLTVLLSGCMVRVDENPDLFKLRTPMRFKLHTGVTESASIITRAAEITANVGAYAADAHGAAINAGRLLRHLYSAQGGFNLKVNSYYTNLMPTVSMQGHGFAHALFAMESHIDDIAFDRGIDPMLLRIKNCIRAGYTDSVEGYTTGSYELDKCIIRGRELTDWDNRRRENEKQSGDIRRGIGMAILCYNGGKDNSAATVNMTFSPDGSLLVMLGGGAGNGMLTELYREKISLIVGINKEMIHFDDSCDLYPNGGEYRTGLALRDAALRLSAMLIGHAKAEMFCDAEHPELRDGYLTESASGHRLLPIFDIVQDIIEQGKCPNVQGYSVASDRLLSFGATFAEVTVNIPLCRVELNNIITVLDNGYISHNDTAVTQALMSMTDAVDFTMGQQITYDEKSGISKNNSKTNTCFHSEERVVEFVAGTEPNSAFNNKPIDDAAFISVAPAVRNAILNATGIKLNSLPITSQKLFSEFEQAGMI